jgi:DNA polymerase III subunit gamma/tau
MLIARVGDGSMRDAQSAFDQVIAFAGAAIAAEDVTTVLGLVRRELLVDIAEAVAREDGPAMFDLTARAIEAGYDLRLVVRELARLTRDLLVVKVDPARVTDPEIAADGERDRLQALSSRFSREDLMRAFEVLAKAEEEIRGSLQPRYHLEMALLRWIHLRQLVPLSELIQGLEKGGSSPARPVSGTARTPAPEPPRSVAAVRPSSNTAAVAKAVETRRGMSEPADPSGNGASAVAGAPGAQSGAPPDFRKAFLAEVRRTRKYFYGTVVAQAQRIEIEPDRILMIFAPQHRPLRLQLDQTRTALEEIASQLAGRKVSVVGVEATAGTAVVPQREPAANAPAAPARSDRQAELRQQALADSNVQAMLDVFEAEIKDVEEM